MIIVLLLILVLAVYLARKTNKRFVIKSLLLAFVLGAVSILLFELLNGPHTECGVNDSVGPCDLSGRLWFDAPLMFLPTILFWTIILVVNHVTKVLKNKLSEKKK